MRDFLLDFYDSARGGIKLIFFENNYQNIGWLKCHQYFLICSLYFYELVNATFRNIRVDIERNFVFKNSMDEF